jgi:hypothetical protein
MSYMAGQREYSQYWTRGSDWNALLTTWGSPTTGEVAAAPLAGEFVQISGSVAASGGGQLEPAYRLSNGITDTPAAGEYAVALMDGAGHDLYTFSFPVSFSPAWDPTSTLESVPFSFVLPWQQGAARIVLRGGGVELASRVVSSTPPTVRVITPNGGGALAGQQEITWSSEDLDGDQLLYTVQYSPDGGIHWTLLAVDLAANSFSWDTSLSPGGTNGRIRVAASDGANTGSDVSDFGFSLANHPPSAAIALPADGNTFLQGYEVALQGEGLDLEEGALEGDRLTWRSDRDGALGNGQALAVNNLSIGHHVLTLTARDSQAAEASATRSVDIVATGQPDVRVSAGDINFWSDPPLTRQTTDVVVNAANIITGALCTFEFHDGDPAAGGTLISTQVASVDPNMSKSVVAHWQPAAAGSHTIFVRVFGCNPPESNTDNNAAARSVIVAEPPTRDLYLPLIVR